MKRRSFLALLGLAPVAATATKAAASAPVPAAHDVLVDEISAKVASVSEWVGASTRDMIAATDCPFVMMDGKFYVNAARLVTPDGTASIDMVRDQIVIETR